MVAPAMPPRGVARPGYVIEHPNREKAESKAVKAIVVLLLLISAALMTIVTIGGWETLEGAKAVQVAYIALYVVMAFFVARWNRGILPVAAAFAVILLIFAAVSGPEWFDRDKAGFDNPPINENILGLITYLLIPVQVLLILFAMRGFQQGWNIEYERQVEGYEAPERPTGTPGPSSPQPA